jgi:outer membrane receptor protein involved in Fe transport
VNSDFSRTRGIELLFQHRGERRTTGSLSYEYSIATGKPADPNRIKRVDPEALEAGDAEPDLNEEFMSWNRPHRLQANLDWRFHKGDAPRLGGLQLPDRWALNFYYTLRSGKPYTPQDTRGQDTGKRNSENAPLENIFDIKFDKYWEPGKTSRLGITLELRNVLDQQPLRVVDPNTGEAPAVGQGIYTSRSSDVPEEVLRDRLTNPAFYGEGRNVRFGVEVTF